MRKRILVIDAFLYLLVSWLFLSCTENHLRDPIEIPFSIENDRIIIEATINGKNGRFLFDTGATESYLNIDTKNLFPVGITNTIYNGRRKLALVYALRKITFGNSVLETNSWVITRSDYLSYRIKEGYDGLLGMRTFEGYWCELSFSKKAIILHETKPGHFSNYSPVTILSKYDTDFYIPINIDNRDFFLSIDTGMYHAIYFPDAVVNDKKTTDYREIVSLEEARRYHLVKTDSIIILDETYNDFSIMTNSFLAARTHDRTFMDKGLLGISFLKYYDWLFDYREIRKGKTTGLYYKPNTPVKSRDYGLFAFIKDIPEFGVINYSINSTELVILSIIKDSIAYAEVGLRPGMRITRINGVAIGELPKETILDPAFFKSVDDYTVIENGVERTHASPLERKTGGE